MKKFLFGFGLVFLLTGCQQQAASDESIVIGGIAPLTGDGALYGQLVQNTANLQLQKINANEGVHGKMLEITWQDGKCIPGEASQAAQKLINIDKVSVIFGGVCSSETLGAAPIAERNKVILLSSVSTNPTITNAGDFIFRVAPSDFSQGKVLAEYAEKMGYEKVGVMTEQSEGAMGISDSFKKYFIGEVVEERFLQTESDFKTRLTKIKAEKPDAIFISPQSPAKAGIIIKQLAELNWEGPLLGHELFVGKIEALEIYKDFILENTLVASTFAAPESEELKSFTELYKNTYGEDPAYMNYTATTIDALNIIAKVLNQVDDPTNSEAIRDALYRVRDYDGVFGTLSFDENGDVNIYHSLFKFDGEEFVPLTE